MSEPRAARDWIDAVVDAGSWRSWDVPIEPGAGDPDYAAALAAARTRSGADEAVLTGRASIAGTPVALIVSEFAFLGGSIGVAAADRIVAAFDRAAAESVPLVAAPASGGTRMQEGTAAFVTMVQIARAVERFRASGLPYLVHLRNPSTGGVLASWGSLGDDVSAAPGAFVGLLGPKVVTALGYRISEAVQRAERLLEMGHLDAVVDPAGFRARASSWLAIAAGDAPAEAASTIGAAGAVHADALIARMRGFLPMRAREGGGIRTGVGWIGSTAAMVIAERGSAARVTVADLAVARHAMEVADRMRLPVVTIVDTVGSALSDAEEEAGAAMAVAETIARGCRLAVPSLALLVGDGTGAGALALCGTDRIIATGNAWLGPLPLRGAAALLPAAAGDPARVAELQRVSAPELLEDGLITTLIPADAGAAAVLETVEAELRVLRDERDRPVPLSSEDNGPHAAPHAVG